MRRVSITDPCQQSGSGRGETVQTLYRRPGSWSLCVVRGGGGVSQTPVNNQGQGEARQCRLYIGDLAVGLGVLGGGVGEDRRPLSTIRVRERRDGADFILETWQLVLVRWVVVWGSGADAGRAVGAWGG